MATKNMDSKKINVTLPSGLIDDIDQCAESHYMTRSGFIAYACNQVIAGEKMQDSIVKMNVLFNKMMQRKEFNFVSDEERKEFENISAAIDTLRISIEHYRK